MGSYNLETADRLYLLAPRVLVRTEHDYAALPPDTVLRIVSTNQPTNVWPVDELAWANQTSGHNRTLRVDEAGDFTIRDFVDAGVVCRVINPRTQQSAGEYKNTRAKL